MSSITIDKRRVQAVVEVATKATAYEIPGLHPLEALYGFAEVLGRVIAAQEGTPILHKDMMRIAEEHIRVTIKAAYSSKGKNPAAVDTGG
jgi:hypothetical protein